MSRSFTAVYLSGLLISFPVFVIFIYTPCFAENLGANNFQVALLSTVHFMTSILGSYLWGSLSDIMGNRKLLPVFSSICFSVILFFLSIAVSPFQVILLRGLVGLILPAYTLPVLALISEKVKREGRGEKLGRFNSSRSIGSTIGLFLAGYLVAYLPLNSIFRLFAFLAVFSIFPLLLIPGSITEFTMSRGSKILTEVKRKMFSSSGEGKQILQKKGLIYVYLGLTLRVICIVGFASFLPVYIVNELGYSQEFLAIFSACGNGLMIIGMFLAGWTADKVGRRIIVTVGFLLSGLTPIFYSISNNLITLSLGRTFHSLGYCFVMTGVSAFVGDVADEERQAFFMGLIYVFFAIGGMVGPLIMGTFLGHLGYFKMGILMSLLAFSALIMTVAKVKETFLSPST